MCGDSKPSADAFKRNMGQPMPVHRKVGYLAINTLRKIFTVSNCCGHPGEPGC